MTPVILRNMRPSFLFAVAAIAVVSICSCSPEPKPARPQAEAPALKPPSDESRRFPQANLVGTSLVNRELMDKPFMPGGTLARYKRGKIEYEMFVARTPRPTDAALLLPDWRKVLTGATLVPSFGGYYGLDAGRPVFVFSKGSWIAGIAGLTEKQADTEARELAAHLD